MLLFMISIWAIHLYHQCCNSFWTAAKNRHRGTVGFTEVAGYTIDTSIVPGHSSEYDLLAVNKLLEGHTDVICGELRLC